MKEIYNSFKLEVVREKTINYTPKTIEGKTDAIKEIAEILEKTFKVSNQTEEAFYLATLDGSNKISGLFEVARGSINYCMVHPREVFKRALLNNAVSVIVAHNHPSGKLDPSREDKLVTKRLFEAGGILGIKLLDHIIIGNNESLSMSDEGWLDF